MPAEKSSAQGCLPLKQEKRQQVLFENTLHFASTDILLSCHCSFICVCLFLGSAQYPFWAWLHESKFDVAMNLDAWMEH